MKYLGNKNRLSSHLTHIFLKYRHYNTTQSALDLFSGTGNVTKIFSNIGYNVDSVDYLFLSKISTFVKTNNTPKIDINHISNINTFKTDGFITNNYSEKVGVNIFKENIANHIDGSLYYLNQIKSEITELEYFYLLYSIVDAADFRSNIMGSYESFYKKGWRKQSLKEWKIDLYHNTTKTINHFFNQYIEDFFIINNNIYDIVYADPPYNGRNYSSMFHVLETISTQYKGETTGKVNRPLNGAKSSNFNYKTQISKSFYNLFQNVSKITNNFVLSYSDDGIIDIDSILEISKLFFIEYQINKIPYRKFNTNKKNNKNNRVNEYIIEFKK
jgi:adenine-specific DNA-methyltransferase